MSKLSLRVAKSASVNGWITKLVAFAPLTISLINLLVRLTLPIFHYDALIKYVERKLAARGVLKRLLDGISGFIWQGATPESLIEGEIWRAVTFFLFCVAFCWVVLRWDESKYFFSGLFAILAGFIYTSIPVDAFPDFIPVAGSADDLIVSLASALTGFTVWGEGVTKSKLKRKVRALAQDKPIKTLEILCEEYGIELDLES